MLVIAGVFYFLSLAITYLTGLHWHRHLRVGTGGGERGQEATVRYFQFSGVIRRLLTHFCMWI